MKKLIGIAGIILIVATFVAVVLGALSWEYFWYVAAATAILAWWMKSW